MSDSLRLRALGSVLIILGTCVGAGMLALPVVTAHENIIMILLSMFLAWALMTFGAFSLLEVNFWLPNETNLISMAHLTLGRWGKVLAWLTYLSLLYSLLCAYLAGVGGVIQALLIHYGWGVARWQATLFALLVLGSVVYRGMGTVDKVNRVLIGIKFLAYFVLIILLVPHVHQSDLHMGTLQWQGSAFMVLITSFGFAAIVPTIRTYLQDDKKLIKRVLIIGSLLPIVVYCAWVAVVKGVVPSLGAHSLALFAQSSNSNRYLMQAIMDVTQSHWVNGFTSTFMFVCLMTSFLGVAISLVDFLKDGLRLPLKHARHWQVYVVTFAPPLFIVLFDPSIFITALRYAGILCVILLILLPVTMLYVGRYRKKIAGERMVWGGRLGIFIIATIAVVALSQAVLLMF